MTNRKTKGATLAFIVASTLIIVILGIAIFFLIRIVGGGKELQNSVDAGNLNLTKNALITPAVPLTISNLTHAQFFNLSDNGRVNLDNINRVFAQALIVQANAQAMQLEGVTMSGTSANAHQVTADAQQLSTQLKNGLRVQGNLQQFFHTVSNQNSIRMLLGMRIANGQDINMTEHQIAYCDIGDTSNVGLSPNQLPTSVIGVYNANKAAWVKTLPVGPNGSMQDVLIGYKSGISFNGNGNIHFIPLKDGRTADSYIASKPHLIAPSTFHRTSEANAGGLPFNWTQRVPNSFLSTGQAREEKSNNNTILTSCAIAQSRGYFQAAIPNGFIRISNASCSGGSGFANTSGQDLYSFLMGSPQFALSPPGQPGKAHFSADQSVVQRIAEAYGLGNQPAASDMAAMTPPLSGAEGPMTSVCGPISNITYPSYPEYMPALLNAYPGLNPSTGNPISTCAHGLELANLELLTFRARMADPVELSSWGSGVLMLPNSRVPLSQGNVKFLPTGSTLSQLLGNNQANARTPNVLRRILQRCYEIDPRFNGDPNTITGWTSVLIGLGQRAFIFYDTQISKLRIALENDTPQWLQLLSNNSAADGRPAAFDRVGQLVSTGGMHPPGSTAPHLINVNTDWGYPTPYDFPAMAELCNRDLYVFSPSTGFRGLLGELTMRSCFGSVGVGLAGACNNTGGDSTPGNPIIDPNQGFQCGDLSVPGCIDCRFTGPC
jgi:hypothetical protein